MPSEEDYDMEEEPIGDKVQEKIENPGTFFVIIEVSRKIKKVARNSTQTVRRNHCIRDKKSLQTVDWTL